MLLTSRLSLPCFLLHSFGQGSEDDAAFEEDAGSPDEAEAVEATAPVKAPRFERIKAKPAAKKISGVPPEEWRTILPEGLVPEWTLTWW